jgi:hypothetical protein
MKSVLFISGGWQGHQPKQCAAIFAEYLAGCRWRVEIAETVEVLSDAEKLKAFDLIVPNWTMGNLTGPQEKNLTAAVRSGVGLAGWHGGMGDAFRNNTEYQFMTGGQFVAHPAGIVEHGVRFIKKDDPLTQGLSDFRLKSERYYMHVDPGNEVLAVIDFAPSENPWTPQVTMPAVWKRRYGQGRVFYSSIGHVAADFEVPEACELVQRGLQWAAR